MQLIGMLDSPYVRRVAISLELMRIPFAHERLSVFRQFGAFAAVNPVVKAPTLVTDDGVALMDSSLILEHLERLSAPERRLTPDGIEEHARGQRLIGLALAASEKTVQIVYEHELRPAERRHQPWIDRVLGQLRAAYRLLEGAVGAEDGWLLGARPLQADVSIAVAWRFTAAVLPGLVAAREHPALARFSDRAESVPEFRAWPFDG